MLGTIFAAVLLLSLALAAYWADVENARRARRARERIYTRRSGP
jgi:hypothetical protein